MTFKIYPSGKNSMIVCSLSAFRRSMKARRVVAIERAVGLSEMHVNAVRADGTVAAVIELPFPRALEFAAIDSADAPRKAAPHA